MSNLRIGFLCSEYPPDPHGGIGIFTRRLATSLAARGHTIHVLAPSARYGLEQDGGVTVHRFARREDGLAHFTALQHRQEVAARLKALATKHQLQIVEAPDYRGEACFCALPCPLVVRCHGSTTALARLRGESPSMFMQMFESRLLSKANARVAVSNFIQRKTSTRHEFHRSIPNFAEAEIFRRNTMEERNPLSFLFVGRVSRRKGIAEACAIAARVLERHASAIFTVAGEETSDQNGSVTEQMKASMPENVRDRVRFVGSQTSEELARLYNTHQFMIFPGAVEAFGLVVLEALLCGCMPLVSSEGGPAEVVSRIFKPGIVVGGVEEFADRIENLLFRGDLDRLSRAVARLAASRYGAERLVTKNEEFYRRVIGETT